MKTGNSKLISILLLLSTIVSAQSGGGFEITQSVIAGGGGQNVTNGPFSLDFTLAEPVAGTVSSNAPYDIESGFWTGASAPVTSGTITGTVTYGNAAAPPKYISNATVTGAGSPNVATVTGAPGANAGQYSLTGFGSGGYTVSLSKTTGQNGITSNDAARVAQHVAGTVFFTNNNQKVSADVSGNNVISSNDAAQIARFVTGLGAPIGSTGLWRFFVAPGPSFPVGASPTSRTYASVTSNIAGEDYIGLLIGEVTGNWVPSAAKPVGAPTRNIAVNLPKLVAAADQQIIVPVNISEAANDNIISYEFNLRYDPTVIQPLADPVDLTGTVSRALKAVANAEEPGLLRVAVYGATPIDSGGVLLNLRFKAVGSGNSVSPLIFERIMFNEGEPYAAVVDGQIALF